MARFCIALAPLVFCTTEVFSQDVKPTKITVVVRGAITGDDAQALRASLKKVKGVKFKTADIQRGEKGQFRHYFSPPFVIEIADLNKIDIGAIAKAVAETKTPSRRELKPSLNLVLYHPAGTVNEGDISALRQALTNVNGVEAQATGGIGGVPAQGRCWVRLEAAGGANLDSIMKALKKANLNLRLLPPK